MLSSLLVRLGSAWIRINVEAGSGSALEGKAGSGSALVAQNGAVDAHKWKLGGPAGH
jgi:hypothetical protein